MGNTVILRRSGADDVDISLEPRHYKVYTQRDIERIRELRNLSEELIFEMKVVASVLPFRVNEYVIKELIDWKRVPADPIFVLTFPQKRMLTDDQFGRMAQLHRHGAGKSEIHSLAAEIRSELNPHPAGQLELNVPRDGSGAAVEGLQHKYRETVLFFPSQGQTCHAYCTFCFRWAQFVGDKSLRMATTEAASLHDHLRRHREVTDLLITGGDPMVMKTKHLTAYLEPLLGPEFDHIQTIRIGTKALSFWPYRFVTDDDASGLTGLFERLSNAGKHVALMAHLNHWRELESEVARAAVEKIRSTGVEIRSQGPLLANINDTPEDWAKMWETQVRLGIIPYYMFVERDTGARHYFEVPLVKAWEIYRGAIQCVSGLGRTARGPSMSAGPGKVEIQGVTEMRGEKVIALRFIQGRNPDWVQRPFFAQYDEKAVWLDQLKPAFGERHFFFEEEYQAICRERGLN